MATMGYPCEYLPYKYHLWQKPSKWNDDTTVSETKDSYHYIILVFIVWWNYFDTNDIWVSNKLLSFIHCAYTKSWSGLRKCNLIKQLHKTNEEWLLWNLTSDKISVKYFRPNVIESGLKRSPCESRLTMETVDQDSGRIRTCNHFIIFSFNIKLFLWWNDAHFNMVQKWSYHTHAVKTSAGMWFIEARFHWKKHKPSAVSRNNCMNILSYSSVIFLYRRKKIQFELIIFYLQFFLRIHRFCFF